LLINQESSITILSGALKQFLLFLLSCTSAPAVVQLTPDTSFTDDYCIITALLQAWSIGKESNLASA
jgi:hypothetical protein